MAMLTLYMYQQVAAQEGKGGLMTFSDGVGTYYPETERDNVKGGGICVDIPGPGQTLAPFHEWSEHETANLYAAGQAQRQETFDKLCEGTYNTPPEPVRMVPGLNPVTGHFDTRPEREDEKAARLEREAGDAAIQHGHITHDELTPDEVDKLSPEEYRAWRKSHPEV